MTRGSHARPGRLARVRGALRWLAVAIVLVGLRAVADTRQADIRIPIEFFHETGCRECEQVRREILPELERRYSGYYDLVSRDTGEETNYVRLVAWQHVLGVTNNEPVCLVVDGRAILAGVGGIRSGLFPALDRALEARAGAGAGQTANPPLVPGPDRALIADRVQAFTLAGVVAAALIDSFNPCAMATLVFFMSLLSVAHIGVRRMALAGGAFVVACFATYLAIGFGLLRVIQALETVRWAGLAIDGLMLVLMVVFAWLSFRDAIRFRRTGDPAAVALQLPAGIKNRIHAIMKRGLRSRSLLLGGLVIGVLVTILESVCTGQVYVPALVLMIKSGESMWRCAGYLLLYNALFVAPLAVILGLTCWGLRIPTLVEWNRRHVAASKVLLGLFFTAMAAMMLLMVLRSAG